ncbi:MAG TPA: hypothetical protein VJH03_23880 [Blastocatellia bacterium]|nr:hypothetical protein [Blastocatellia bacterium]
MRRLYLLMGLAILVVWLLIDDTSAVGGNASPAAAGPPSAQQQTCCPEGSGTSPHKECVGGACVDVYECGFDNCAACQGCDPDGTKEWQCIQQGWIWDPFNCLCSPPGCDPDGSLEWQCVGEGGTWDPYTCWCTMSGCNPGPAILAHTTSTRYCYETGGEESFVMECSTTWRNYEVFCQDGSLYASWTIEENYCYWNDYCYQ